MSLALLLVSSAVVFHLTRSVDTTGPRYLSTNNHRIAGCNVSQRDSFTSRLACGDPLGKRGAGSSITTIQVDN